MWSISLLLTGSWTTWPWWQVWDLSKGCPEGQSGYSSCYNILHAKSLLSPLSWTVNDYMDTTSHWSSKILTRNSKKEILSCKHVLLLMKKKAQVGPKAQRAEPGGWKLISRSWNQWKNFICPAGFDLLQTSYSCFQPPFLHWKAYMCLSHHIY